MGGVDGYGFYKCCLVIRLVYDLNLYKRVGGKLTKTVFPLLICTECLLDSLVMIVLSHCIDCFAYCSLMAFY